MTGGTVTLRHTPRLHHLGLGRQLAGTRLTVLAADLIIPVHNTGTCEVIRTRLR